LSPASADTETRGGYAERSGHEGAPNPALQRTRFARR